MSYKYNQSRAERSESTQYRKTGRSGSSSQQRQFSGGASTKGGGGSTDLSNRSFKKHNSNAQGGQPTARSSNVDSSNSSTARALQNGGHHQQPTNNAPMQNITQAIPKAPPSNVSPASSESKAPKTPAKDPGDPSKSFRLQFGSISPGVMNGMQVPARTSSVPPNLHEHKQAQASLRTAPVMPIPSVPKQQQIPKTDAGILDHPNAGEAQPISKSQVSVAPSQKPTVHPIPSMPMQLPLHQPRVPVQLGGSNPQIQSQPISGPMPMPMSLPPPMFVPHPMQSQGMMRQNFPPQMGNMGIKPGPQFLQQPAQSKLEPDDWEDAAEISSPHLETSENQNQDNDGSSTKKYSRDFLLKFSEQCSDLPEGFEITSDIADSLVSNVNFSRDSYPSPGRNIDRHGGGSRAKFPGAVMSGRGDMRADGNNYVGNNIGGFRPGQGGNNYGVLRNPRAQPPVQYAGGILGGPMQNFGPQGRNNSDSDRWQRATGFQRGLMPSPHTQMAIMHKAEKKYEIGKVTDEEQAKQRQLKGILNKLTPQNFEKLFEQVKQVNIDNVITLSGVISQIFDKALMEPTFCEMYANFCFHLAAELPELNVDNEKITFKRLLLNKCQEEFERGEREEEEANKAEEEGEVKQTAEEREEKRLKARRRMLGNIRLIGELYKKRVLTERIMHACINKLLGQYQNPDEENIEALCKLMSTIGEMIDHPKAKEHMDAYFDIMLQLSNNMKLSSRVRFMLKDAIDLRKNKWQQRRKVEGPKKIEEVHRDAAQERQAQSSRLSRAPSMGNSSARRGPPNMEYSPRSSPNMMMSSSPSPHRGGPPPHLRGYGSSHDARMTEERISSVPLPQRPLGDDSSSITLGPQGGLARGMAFRGQQISSSPNVPLAEMPSPQRNGFSSMPERPAYGQREEIMPRYNMSDRFAAPPAFDQSHSNVSHVNRELRSTDRSRPDYLPAQGGPPTSMQNVPSSDKVLPDERLRDKSLAAIREFYSARDEKEVALCIKDLNNPGFYSSMISIWITDSFERKDMEREILTKLLIDLTKPRDGILSQDQLIKGFESVLAVLEDAVNDAPKAAEFLGCIFGKVIVENVISLSEIGRLIYEGGEEQGSLLEIGLAAEVLGCVLEIIKSEKGDSVLNEIRLNSNLQIENFRPKGSKKSLRIDKFI